MTALVFTVLAVALAAGLLLYALTHHRQETTMTAGLHDHPGIYPPLPGREPNQILLDTIPENDVFRAAWEFKLSHELTDSEGSAFWHGVNVQHRADQQVLFGVEAVAAVRTQQRDRIRDEILPDLRARAERAESERAALRERAMSALIATGRHTADTARATLDATEAGR